MRQMMQTKDYFRFIGLTMILKANFRKFSFENLSNSTLKRIIMPMSKEKKSQNLSDKLTIPQQAQKSILHSDKLVQVSQSLCKALQTFGNFCDQFGIVNNEEKKVFAQNYSPQTKDYYQILEIPNNASFKDIQEAYRKLALKFHPLKNLDNKEAIKRFIEVNEAYNVLMKEHKTSIKNDFAFNPLQRVPAAEYHEFPSLVDPDQEDYFQPQFRNSKIRTKNRLDKLMNEDSQSLLSEDAEIRIVHQVYLHRDGYRSKKIVKEKKKVVNGQVYHEIKEEYHFPFGSKQIINTVKKGQKVETKVSYQ